MRLKPTEHEALTALRDLAPENPFTDEPLSGGPTCIECGSDEWNAWHSDADYERAKADGTHCRWVQARKAIPALEALIAERDALRDAMFTEPTDPATLARYDAIAKAEGKS